MLEVGINSYLTLSEAEELMNEQYLSFDDELVTWNALSNSDKEIVCKRGSKSLEPFCYVGYKSYSYPMQFPRTINGVEQVPRDIKLGAIANGIMSVTASKSERYKLAKDGVKSMTVGPNSISIDRDITKVSVYPVVLDIISNYRITSVNSLG